MSETFTMPENLSPEHEAPVVETQVVPDRVSERKFKYVFLLKDIADHRALGDRVLPSGAVYSVVDYDPADGTVQIRPKPAAKTKDGMIWLDTEEYRPHFPSAEQPSVDQPGPAATTAIGKAAEAVAQQSVAGPTVAPPTEGNFHEPEPQTWQSGPASAAAETAPPRTYQETAVAHLMQLKLQHYDRLLAERRNVESLLHNWEMAKKRADSCKTEYTQAEKVLANLIEEWVEFDQELEHAAGVTLADDSEERGPGERYLEAGETARESMGAPEVISPEPTRVGGPPPAGTVVIDGKPVSENPFAWEDVPLEDLVIHGFSKAIAKKFQEAELFTLGDVERFRKTAELTEIEGVGATKAARYEDALARYFKDHPR